MMWALLPAAWKMGIVALSILALLGGASGCYMKIRHDAVVEERNKVEAEKQDAINDATRAKRDLRTLCDSFPDDCVRKLEPWFRD